MNIITLNYELEFKNFIKNKISSQISEISNNMIENLFSFDNDKYIKLISDLQQNTKNLIINIIKEAIYFFDEKFRNSEERKKEYYINIRYDCRTITTIFGDIEIKRTYYSNKDETEYFYFIDNLLGLEKYDRYDPIYKSYIIDSAIKTNQNLSTEIVNDFTSTIEDKITNKNKTKKIPRQTVYNWIKKWHIPMIEYPPITSDSNTLYVMGDEKWIHEQIHGLENSERYDAKGKKKHHFIMSKCFVCFTGIIQYNHQRRLENRMIFETSSSSPWNSFLDFVTKVYDFEKLDYIIFLSDAGKWLTAGAPDLRIYPKNKVIMCLCEFHAREYINRITTDENIRGKLNKAIDDNKKSKFKKIMKNIKSKISADNRLDKIEKYENYIIKNWNKIQNMFKSECRSSMESHISHCVAAYFSARPKAYSRTNIETLLKLNEYKINGIDIQSLYLKSYKNEETITIKKEDLNFSVFESSSYSNIPIIEKGLKNHLFNILNSISHGY